MRERERDFNYALCFKTMVIVPMMRQPLPRSVSLSRSLSPSPFRLSPPQPFYFISPPLCSFLKRYMLDVLFQPPWCEIASLTHIWLGDYSRRLHSTAGPRRPPRPRGPPLFVVALRLRGHNPCCPLGNGVLIIFTGSGPAPLKMCPSCLPPLHAPFQPSLFIHCIPRLLSDM